MKNEPGTLESQIDMLVSIVRVYVKMSDTINDAMAGILGNPETMMTKNVADGLDKILAALSIPGHEAAYDFLPSNEAQP